MKISEAREGLTVFDCQGVGTLHKNTGYEDVSQWYVKWSDGSECAVLCFDYLTIHPEQDNGAMSYTEAAGI